MSPTRQRPDTADTGVDGQGRSPSGLAGAGVLLGFVAVLAVWLTLSHPSAGPASTAVAARPAPTGRPVGGGPRPGGAGCGLAPGSPAVPTAAPAGVVWSLFDTGLEPSSPTAGPGIVDGPVARCFAHSPDGALIAAVQIPDRLSLAGPDRWERIARSGLAAGAGRDVFMAKAAAAFAQPAPAGAGAYPAQLAAFKFLSYSADRATVAVVYRTPAGLLVAGDVTVVWEDGDWKVALLADGTTGRPPAAVASIDGYVELRGV